MLAGLCLFITPVHGAVHRVRAIPLYLDTLAILTGSVQRTPETVVALNTIFEADTFTSACFFVTSALPAWTQLNSAILGLTGLTSAILASISDRTGVSIITRGCI
jgi:hypothetical protein